MDLKPITRIEHFYARIAGDPADVLSPITREEHFLQRIIDNGGPGPGGEYQPKITATGILKGEGSGTVSAADAGTDYVAPATIVNGSSRNPTITPEDNTIYDCGTIDSLTLVQPPLFGAYMIVFISGATATTISGATGVWGLEDFVPESNMMYEINVMDNRAVVGSWEVP